MKVRINRHRWFAPILIVAVTTTVMGGFAGMFAGGLVVTAFGLVWGLALGVMAARVSRRERWRPSLANGALLLASLVAGTLFGLGLLDLMFVLLLLAMLVPASVALQRRQALEPAVSSSTGSMQH
jgi:hypothetical protein